MFLIGLYILVFVIEDSDSESDIPEEMANADIAECGAPVFCPCFVEGKMTLLVSNDLSQAAAKALGGIGPLQQGECHEFKGLEFVMRKAVKCQPASMFMDQALRRWSVGD